MDNVWVVAYNKAVGGEIIGVYATKEFALKVAERMLPAVMTVEQHEIKGKYSHQGLGCDIHEGYPRRGCPACGDQFRPSQAPKIYWKEY